MLGTFQVLECILNPEARTARDSSPQPPPPAPSEQKQRPHPPPARSEQDTTEKFCFPFRRKTDRAQNQNCKQNFSVVGRAIARGGGAASLVQEFLIK